jgi:hypothetical protein
MRLESARALKQELLARVVPQAFDAIRAEGGFSVTTFSLKRAKGAEPALAVGIASGTGKGDVRLAVRVQRRSFERTAGFLDRVRAMSKDEIEIRYIGRVAKGARRPRAAQPGQAAPEAAGPWYRARQRPLEAGTSVGHYNITAGTLGAFARRRRDGAALMLSNNHVLANEDSARVGDDILQPGNYDGGRRRLDVAGHLADWVRLKQDTPNLVDAAIATVADGVAYTAGIYRDLGKLKGVQAAPVSAGEGVAKIGRTSGLTRGRVTAVEVDGLAIEYDMGSISFDNQIEIEGAGDLAFSSGGDSGSLILGEGGEAVALLFAGSERGGTNDLGLTYANPIGTVLDALAIDLLSA